MTVDQQVFRQAMRLWTTGVTVVTSAQGEEHRGMTVSSFTSVSVEPPVICVSINRQARTHALIQSSGRLGVTILSEAQQELSDCFAGKIDDENGDRFSNVDTFTLVSEVPFLKGGIAFFDCRVIQKMDIGTNTVFLGEVEALQYNERGEPLLYTNQSYQLLQK